MSEGKELSTETRSLIAAVLCLLVIAGWSLIYKPPQPTPTKPNPVTPAPASVPPAGPLPAPSRASTKTEPVVAMHSAGEERSVVIESDLYRVQISNRGATVRSWQLTKFTDDHTPPRTLDLVHADVAQQEGGWPLSLALDDTQQETALNNALFEIKSSGSVPQAGDVLQGRSWWIDPTTGQRQSLAYLGPNQGYVDQQTGNRYWRDESGRYAVQVPTGQWYWMVPTQ